MINEFSYSFSLVAQGEYTEGQFDAIHGSFTPKVEVSVYRLNHAASLDWHKYYSTGRDLDLLKRATCEALGLCDSEKVSFIYGWPSNLLTVVNVREVGRYTDNPEDK